MNRILYDDLLEGNLLSPILSIQLPLLLFCSLSVIALRLRFTDLKLISLYPKEWLYAFLLAMMALMAAVAVFIPVLALHKFISPDFFETSLEQAKVLQEAITPSSGFELLLNLFLVALIPAIVEELFFRGLLLDSFMRLGPVWAITISSVTFGVMHQMPMRIPSLIVVGFILGIFKYRTGKLTASILMHFIYNSFLIALTYFASEEIPSNIVSFIWTY